LKKSVFRKALSVALTLAMMMMCFPALPVMAAPATLLVDQNATPDSTTFNTIAEAVAAAVDGDTIQINAGTYNESLEILGKTNLTIVGAGADQVFVTGTDGDAGWGSWGMYSTLAVGDDANDVISSNVDISGITFDYSGAGAVAYGSTAIIMGGSSHVKVHNCTLIGGATSGGVVQLSATNNHITFDSNLITGDATTGFALMWGTSDINADSHDTVFSNNIVTNAVGFDFSRDVFWYGTSYNVVCHTDIINNTILGTIVNNGNNGDGGTNNDYVQDTIIANNIVDSITLYGSDDATITNNAYLGTANIADTNAVTIIASSDIFTDAANGDYTVKQDSAVVGTANHTTYPLATDFAGTARVNNTIGAYEGEVAAPAGPTTYIVDPTAVPDSTTFNTIAQAAAVAADGDTIQINAGTYAEDVTIDGINQLTITGVNLPVVEGSITAFNCSDLTISALNVTAGSGKDAITLTDCDKTIVTQCNIKDSRTGIVTTGTTAKPMVTITRTKIKGCTTAIIATKTVNNIFGNVIYDGTTGIVGVKGAVDYEDTASFNIDNNTFYNISGYSIDVDQPNNVDGDDTKLTDMDVLNNIFSRATGTGEFIRLLNKSHGFYFEGNLYNATASDKLAYTYGSSNTLADEIALGPDDTTSALGDPKFKDVVNGDFTLATDSPAIGLGTQEDLAPTVDMLGNTYTVTTGKMEAGAYDSALSTSDPASDFLKDAVVPVELPSFTLDNASIDENNAVGDTIGTFSETDPAEGVTYTYSLPSGLGDNASFTVEGNTLKANFAFDYETKASYEVQVAISDGTTTSEPVAFTITVNDVNEIPPLTSFTLGNASINENNAVGATVGTFAETAPVNGKTYTYSLPSGLGDNASFTIVGKTLKAAAAFDYETKTSYVVQVAISDGTTTSNPVAFTITVNNSPENLPAFTLNNQAIDENNVVGATIGTFVETNPINGKTYTYSLPSGQSDNASFTIVGKTLKAAATLDYETKTSYEVKVAISDGTTTSTPATFTIAINNVNESSTSSNSGSSSGSNTNNTTSKSTGLAISYGGSSVSDTAGESSDFSDIAIHWAKSAILDVYAQGIIAGYGDGTVKPQNNASRAEFTSMIVRMLNLKGIATSDFADVNTDAWYAEAVSVAVSNGLVSGQGDGVFNPNSTITREEAMVMAANALAKLNVSGEATTAVLSKFADSDSISSWAKDAAALLVEKGILSGSNGNLNPKASITRAEICVIINKIITEYR